MEVAEVTMETMDAPVTGDVTSDVTADGEMVQYVIYSGEGDQPIGLEELRDALTKLTGQQVNVESKEENEDSENHHPPALSHDTDLNFRLSAERMVGEVSFVDDNIIENRNKEAVKKVKKKSDPALSNRLIIDDVEDNSVGGILRRRDNQRAQQQQHQIPSQITIETEYGPITLDTNKLTPGQLEGTEQITVNLLTTDPNGDATKEITETRGLKLPPGLLAPTRPKALFTSETEETMQGTDFNSVLQQLTDLCSEQNPLPVQENDKSLLKDTDGLEDFMSLKIPQQEQKQSGVIEVDRLESFLKSKFGDSAKIQIHPTGVVVEQSTANQNMVLKPVICCAAHSELKNQETRRRMLPIPLDVTKCPECHKACLNRKNLRLHIQRFHVPDFKHQCQTRARVIPPPPEDIITDIPVLVETAENLAELGGEKSAPKAYQCAVCDTQFTTQKEYVTHVQDHDEKHLSCTLCGMKYKRITQLRNHVNVVHEGAQNYNCQYCMQAFENTLDWAAHEKLHHSGNDDTIECLTCKSQIPKSKFRHHMGSLHHVVYKAKVDCVFCGARYNTPEQLAKHTQHLHNFEKYVHLCQLCYKAFPTTSECDRHIMKAHTDEEMQEAEIEFSWQPRDCYKRQCARCGKMFPSYQKLKQHYDKHGDEMNACLLCGNEFHWIVNLDVHYKKEHGVNELVNFGVTTPTMNILRHENGEFELVSKVGRQYASRFDLVDVEPCEENENSAVKVIVMEHATVGKDQPYQTQSRPRVVMRPPPRQKTITTPKSVTAPKTYQKAQRFPQPEKVHIKHYPASVNSNVYNKVVGKTDFDYRKYLPVLDPSTDLVNVKAPRHSDIVIGRPATVINLARVWSRRERGLFYMGNEADKFRRAAATIPKKRIGEKWVEMPLFVDELSGKLVTVEGMAELWRERAQIFLDYLGKGQNIHDFLPLYELGQNKKGGKPLAKTVEAAVQRNETSIQMLGEEETPKINIVKANNPNAKDTTKEASKSGNKKDGKESDGESGSVDSVVSDDDLEQANVEEVGEESDQERGDDIDETMYTRKVMVRNADGTLVEADPKKLPSHLKKEHKQISSKRRTRREPEKDIVPEIMSGIKKAKRELKARATGSAKSTTGPSPKKSTSSTDAKKKKGVVKARKGRPPGLNPNWGCPEELRAYLILTNIRDVIGDAKKIIVQMEPSSPERKRWKKQTARKSITRPRVEKTGTTRSSSRHSRFEKKEEKDVEETRAKKRQAEKDSSLDEIDGGPRAKRSHREEKSAKAQEDKGAEGANKNSRTNASKPGEKRSAAKSEANNTPPAKKSKTTTSNVVSPRAATLTGSSKNKPVESDSKAKKKLEPDAKNTVTPNRTQRERKPTAKAAAAAAEAAEIESAKKTASKPTPAKTSGNDCEKRRPGRPRKQAKEEESTHSKKAPTPPPESTSKPTESESNTAKESSPDPEMPLLEIEIQQDYDKSQDSPLPSTSSTSDDISRETKRAMEFLPADFDMEEASLNTKRKSIKVILHEEEATGVKVVGSALSPTKESDKNAGDAWDAIVMSPSKSKDS